MSFNLATGDELEKVGIHQLYRRGRDDVLDDIHNIYMIQIGIIIILCLILLNLYRILKLQKEEFPNQYLRIFKSNQLTN